MISVELRKEINGEMLTRETLVEKHKGLVHRVCNRNTYRAEKLGLEYDDIASVGFIGLIKAFERFDGVKFPVRFSTYAIPMIMGEIQRVLRDESVGAKYPRSVKDLAYLIIREELEDSTIDEISMKLEVDRQKVLNAISFLRHGNNPESFEKPLKLMESHDPINLHSLIGSDDDVTQLFVNDFLNSLPVRERIILTKTMDGVSQYDIGDLVGISQVQVSRIIKRIGVKYLQFNGEQTKKKDVKYMRTAKGDIETAKKLVLEGKLHVNEISAMTGTNLTTLKKFKYSQKKTAKPKVVAAKEIEKVVPLIVEEVIEVKAPVIEQPVIETIIEPVKSFNIIYSIVFAASVVGYVLGRYGKRDVS